MNTQITAYWASTKQATGLILVENGKITRTPPIWKKFVGQPASNILNWLQKQPGCIIQEVDGDEED